MGATDSFAEFLREQLEPLGHITMRRMFGKTGLFCDGVMFGMVKDNTLYFRVDDDNRVAFEEAHWTERRPHIAGAVGAAITQRCFDLGWMERTQRSHAVTVTPLGRRGLHTTFGINASER